MTKNEFAAAYDNLSQCDQAGFLAHLLHDLTISMRGMYSDESQVVSSKSRSGIVSINEIEHQVSGYLILVLCNAPDRPSGVEVLSGLLGWAGLSGAEQDIMGCAERALTQVQARIE